jgi:O-antigen ligase
LSKRGLAAPLLFLALALAAKGSVDAAATLWLCGLAVLWASGALLPRSKVPGTSVLGFAVFGYAAWLVLTNTWVNSYTAAASYDAAFLIGGFLIGRRAGRHNADLLFAIALAFAVGLAAWSIWQRVTGTAPRGHALFETPATLASVINLVLLPGLILAAAGRRNPWLFAALALLAGAIIGTASRGGWIALLAGGVAAFLLLRRAAITVDRKAALTLLAVFGIGYLLSLVAPLTWETTFGTAPASAGMRLGLYEAAIAALFHSSWLFGSGYLAFRYVLEAARPVIPGYQEAVTYFVHNDYLQSLLELGIPGLLLLVLLASLPMVQVWRLLPRLALPLRVPVIALAAATTSMAVHALVDFPFYITVCLLVYGGCIGLLDALLADAEPACVQEAVSPLRRGATAAVWTIAVWILAKPAVAEAASEYAKYQWGVAQGESAAYWFEVARRIDAGDWRYHWYAGQFWFVQAQTGTNAAAARLADRAFAEGFAANPREVANLLWRISTHIYLRSLLAAPAEQKILREWGDLALALAPLDPGVQKQRELIARFERKQLSQ